MREADYRLLASALCLLKSGNVEVRTDKTESLVVKLYDGTINVDFFNPSSFKSDVKKRIGILDSLGEMKILGKALGDKGITLLISRKNKPVLKMGKTAKPSLSRIATRSKEIQILNLKELRNLDKEF